MFEFLIILLAGFGAGVVTGLVGASAVTIAAPLLIVFLGYPSYLAIGIALSIDVFSSLTAILVYRKHKRIRLRPAFLLFISSLIMVLIGSYFSIDISSKVLGGIAGLGILGVGISMALKSNEAKSILQRLSLLRRYKKTFLILFGLWIGATAGVFGAGGGIMILSVLILLLGYETHEAIGTSVLMMIFISLLGGSAHYLNMSFSIELFLIGSLGSVPGAFAAAKWANNLREDILTRVVGVVLVLLGIILFFAKVTSL